MDTFKKNPGLFRMILQGMAVGAIALCAAFGGVALAQQGQTGVSYRLVQDPRNPNYQIALEKMQSMYKKDPWHWDGTGWLHYPIIGIGETFLNDDKFTEIIAYPTEDTEEGGKFCPDDGKCPHIVLEVREKSVRTLALVHAYTITRDDKNANGYWNLRVYTKHPDVDAYYYEVYAYDPKKDTYVPAPQ